MSTKAPEVSLNVSHDIDRKAGSPCEECMKSGSGLDTTYPESDEMQTGIKESLSVPDPEASQY